MLLVRTRLDLSPISGIGLFADQFIPANTIVWRFDARFDQVFSPRDLRQMPHETALQTIIRSYFSTQLNSYVLCFDNARFMNHSQAPNTLNIGAHEFSSQTVSTRDINIGEEITTNYFEYDEDADWKINGGQPLIRSI